MSTNLRYIGDLKRPKGSTPGYWTINESRIDYSILPARVTLKVDGYMMQAVPLPIQGVGYHHGKPFLWGGTDFIVMMENPVCSFEKSLLEILAERSDRIIELYI